MATFLNEALNIEEDAFEEHGAFNISVINDLPLFIDPFLLFHSQKTEYGLLHDQIIQYLIFLRDKAAKGIADRALLKSWYCFPEIKQTWLGFSMTGNSGRGLGIDFAGALHTNLHRLFPDFGSEQITESSHIEKVCLIAPGVGRDNISDFTTNLIKNYLCEFTQAFCDKYLSAEKVRNVAVNNARFNFVTETWERSSYRLPWVNNDFVILTPKDMLTRDENWINKEDLVRNFEAIPKAIPDEALRAQVSNYFFNVLAKHKDKEPSAAERGEAAVATLLSFPQIIDYYIRHKEQTGDRAKSLSAEKVRAAEYIFVRQIAGVQHILASATDFYAIGRTTYDEAHARLKYLKDVVENKGGHRLFYHDGMPIQREQDLQILFRLVWFGSPSDVGTEANDGRGPVDFKISRGARDKTLVEMKLAKNTHLERNLKKQLEIYQAASDAAHGIKAIIYFTEAEEERAVTILEKLGLLGSKDVILIDARSDNKLSGSKAA